MQDDADIVDAQLFHRLVQNDLAAGDGKATFSHQFGDIAAVNRPVERACVRGGADGDELLSIHLFGDGFGLFLQFKVTRL